MKNIGEKQTIFLWRFDGGGEIEVKLSEGLDIKNACKILHSFVIMRNNNGNVCAPIYTKAVLPRKGSKSND